MNGTELIKRHSNNQAYGLTTPLITLASGAKMGKTTDGAIWLDKKFFLLITTGNFGEILMIKM